ncbi:GNAT family N-acetyltransferase [Streptomyces longispororuber]|uniref:GNAT family N-acetyltransferase n=1 Tax=Streptomyces longispororuber TaxID=68230 RepID=UPI00210D5BBF|nr:GNAT family N-acetyltransferase [Streptomyces longispororuber]MCQ4212910.1 GNAT family N-acetyltransferase [Streptomyces longispororuber]
MPIELKHTIAPGTLARSPQPSLRSADGQLTLRAPESTDAPAVFEAFQDPALSYWHARTMDSLDEARAWVATTHEGWREEGTAQWLVTRTADGAPLGRMALKDMNLWEGLAEVAYWMLPAARGQGVAPRALDTLTDWAFATGFHRLDLLHSTRNEPSCRVAAKAGYPLEGTRRSSALHTDGWHDMHVHVRIQESYEKHS